MRRVRPDRPELFPIRSGVAQGGVVDQRPKVGSLPGRDHEPADDVPVWVGESPCLVQAVLVQLVTERLGDGQAQKRLLGVAIRRGDLERISVAPVRELGLLDGKLSIDRVENDALAAAYGEYCLNEDAPDSLIYIGLGTGVGGGLIHAGKPFPGQHGVAMEVGHLIVEQNGRLCGCGNRGCMEKYASATGLSLSYKAATGLELDTGKIAELARSGDEHAVAAYNLAGASLAQALAHILKVVDVGQVVIGGGMSKAWPLMRDAFDQRLQADLIPVLRDKIAIRTSSSGDQAGIIGAALLSGDRSGI